MIASNLHSRCIFICYFYLLLLPHVMALRPLQISRGVNLGAFLALEPWLRPSLFEVPLIDGQEQPIDEWTLSQYHGIHIDEVMAAHYDSWVTSQDLQLLASAGINAVRIGVGYWIVDRNATEPFVSPKVAWPYLIRVLDWCHQLQLSVQIEIHGMPGSQNGFDHSGRRGSLSWLEPANYQRALEVLRLLTSKLRDEGMLTPTGPITQIQPANEPWLTIPLDVLRQFYVTAYEIIRNITSDVAVVISDSFRLPDPSWHVPGGFLPTSSFRNVIIDEHFYQIFNDDGLRMSKSAHIDNMLGFFRFVVAPASAQIPVMIGEFSLATNDCARWLNGVGRGVRWDGTHDTSTFAYGNCTGDEGNDYTQFSVDYKTYLRKWAVIQFQTYENALGTADSGSAGYFFWNFKTEGHRAPQWDFLLGIREGWIPYPVTTTNSTYSGPVQLPTFEPLESGIQVTKLSAATSPGFKQPILFVLVAVVALAQRYV